MLPLAWDAGGLAAICCMKGLVRGDVWGRPWGMAWAGGSAGWALLLGKPVENRGQMSVAVQG